jgi:ubiquinone biosynthesis protein
VLQAFQDLNRLRQIAQIVTRHGFGAYLDSTRLGDMLGKREAEAVREAAQAAGAAAEPAGPAGPDRKTAARFRRMLLELGPTFIKLGQLLSARPDILPSHWVDELSELQDAVPPIPVAAVRAEIERGLGRSVAECFAELDPLPLASASIAQVHRARTHSGEPVVVKVQRPGTRARIEADLGLLREIARLVEAIVEETGVYTPTDIVEEFDRSVHEELDFGNEARNARAMHDAAKSRAYVVIPRVHDDLSSETVLTLEYVEGVKVSEVSAAAGYDLEQVAKNIIDAAFRQLFEDGLFHGDPHPGNILVLPGDRIALIDFGLVGRLTKPMQEALVTMILAVSLRDADSVARVLTRIGLPDSRTPIATFRGDIAEILDRYLGLKLAEIRTSTLLRDLLDLAVKHRIRVPKEYAVLSKASVTLEGIVRRLYPNLDILELGMPYAQELLKARFNPSDARGTLMKSLLKLQSLTEDVPAQLQQILQDLEAGKFRVNVTAQSLDQVAANVRIATMAVFLGLVGAALIIGGFIALAASGWPGLPLAGAIALGVAGVTLAVASTLLVATGPFKKLSIRRLLDSARK